MEKKSLSKYLPIACGVLLLVVGILLCFRRQLGENAISIIMGAGSIAFGAIYVVYCMITAKTIKLYNVLLAAVFIAFGVVFITQDLISIAFEMIPWILIFGGALVMADALLMRFARKKGNLAGFILYLLCGAAATILGICVQCIPKLQDTFVSVAFGIALIVFALYVIVNEIVKKVKAKKAAKDSGKNAGDDESDETEPREDLPESEESGEPNAEETDGADAEATDGNASEENGGNANAEEADDAPSTEENGDLPAEETNGAGAEETDGAPNTEENGGTSKEGTDGDRPESEIAQDGDTPDKVD